MACQCLIYVSFFLVLFTTVSSGKPSAQVVTIKCEVKENKLALEALFRSNIKAKDVAMCYVTAAAKACKDFQGCVYTPGLFLNSIKCSTFEQFDEGTYDIYLKTDDKMNKTILMKKFTPSVYRKQCINGYSALVSYAVTKKTPYEMTVQANLTRDIFSYIRFADIKLTSDDLRPVTAHCNVSDVDPKASICQVDGLHRCTRYKICITIYTTTYRRVETCFKTTTGYVAPPTPKNFAGFSLNGYEGYSSKSILKWDPIPNFDAQFDHFYVAYYQQGDFRKDSTRDTGLIVTADLNRPVALKYCSSCGCSRVVSKNIFKLNNQSVVSSLWNQVDKWQKLDMKRQNMWTGVAGGLGGGFLVAMIAVAVYLRNKKKRQRQGLLTSSKRVTYSKFGNEDEAQAL